MITNRLTMEHVFVGGVAGGGFLPVKSLLEELRIAYRGWENMEMDMSLEAERKRPRIGDSLSAEVRGAIEALRNR